MKENKEPTLGTFFQREVIAAGVREIRARIKIPKIIPESKEDKKSQEAYEERIKSLKIEQSPIELDKYRQGKSKSLLDSVNNRMEDYEPRNK